MPFPLLHLRRSSDWSIIQSTNTNMLFQSLPIGFYILEITGTVTNIGFYRFDITCGHTSKPTAAPTYRPTAQTVSPSISPTLSPSNPTYAVPTAFPSATPTITNFKSRINCGESISGIFSSGENLHWYAFNIDEPGWREVIMELCVPNVKIAVILYDENDLPIWIEQNGVISTDESGNDGGANGARNPADCDTALYINKIEATKYHLPVGQYMILIDQRGYEVDGEKVKYELRVKCEIPSDASEIFKQLPLSAWLFTDAYDDPDCQNPAHLWWCSKHSYTLSSFFGVDMGALFTVYYFAAWGLFHQSESPSEWGNEWVTTFNLEFSDDGITFAEYDVNPILIPEWRAGGFWAHIGFLPEIRLEQPITARYFRFIPVDFHNAMTMGINAYGHS